MFRVIVALWLCLASARTYATGDTGDTGATDSGVEYVTYYRGSGLCSCDAGATSGDVGVAFMLGGFLLFSVWSSARAGNGSPKSDCTR